MPRNVVVTGANTGLGLELVPSTFNPKPSTLSPKP